MVIFAEVTENESIIEKHLRDIDPLRGLLHRSIVTSVVYMTDVV